MVSSIGLFRIRGTLTGERTDCSVSCEEATSATSKHTWLLVFQNFEFIKYTAALLSINEFCIPLCIIHSIR
ncbi:unnamed protein product [Strongylus vulgaris]|uniref:Uncharacterized protein n=1 Tax=Strongylus vulgaris TaxID=40348 RepID=A0A3P7JP28_STRVU|nr:unnamed protein product [Strongylus vulgaris]